MALVLSGYALATWIGCRQSIFSVVRLDGPRGVVM
jgi:hypothetical protein